MLRFSNIGAKMIQSAQFRNFKVLTDTSLPLGCFTLIIGPNGSGKSTALQALLAAANPGSFSFSDIASANSPPVELVEVTLRWGVPYKDIIKRTTWTPTNVRARYETAQGSSLEDNLSEELNAILSRLRIYSFNPNAIAAPVQLSPAVELTNEGGS